METLILVGLAFLIGKFWGGDLSSILHVSHPSAGPSPEPHPDSTTTVVKFPEVTPGGLPPFPTGWKVAKTSGAIVERAWKLLPQLALGEHKIEQGPDGRWLAYYKVKMGEKTGVTVYEPKANPTSLAPATT